MHQSTLTMVGTVVTEPLQRQTRNGVAVTTFRLATTGRRFDHRSGGYIDTEAMSIEVETWRDLAARAAEQLTEGSPVIVHGRLRARPKPGRGSQPRSPRPDLVLDALSIGLDLARVQQPVPAGTDPAATEAVGDLLDPPIADGLAA